MLRIVGERESAHAKLEALIPFRYAQSELHGHIKIGHSGGLALLAILSTDTAI